MASFVYSLRGRSLPEASTATARQMQAAFVPSLFLAQPDADYATHLKRGIRYVRGVNTTEIGQDDTTVLCHALRPATPPSVFLKPSLHSVKIGIFRKQLFGMATTLEWN